MRWRCWGLAMFERSKNEAGAWTYADPSVHSAVLHLHFLGVDLPAIDDWIEAEPWPDSDQLRRVLEWRERALFAGSDDAAEGWGLFLTTLVAMNRREAFMHPRALRDKRRQQQVADFSSKGVTLRRKYTNQDHEAWRAEAERLQGIRAASRLAPLSKRALAERIAGTLNLPDDSVETIRKVI